MFLEFVVHVRTCKQGDRYSNDKTDTKEESPRDVKECSENHESEDHPEVVMAESVCHLKEIL